MRHILILKTKEDTVIINLPENDLYSFFISRFFRDDSGEFVGVLKLQYAHKSIIVDLGFIDLEDSEEFEETLLEYFTNGALPIEVEGSKGEMKYWMEFEVTRVRVQNV